MMPYHQFKWWYGILAIIALSGYMSAIALYHAGGQKRQSAQRKWARRLWQVTELYIFVLFVWTSLYLVRFDP